MEVLMPSLFRNAGAKRSSSISPGIISSRWNFSLPLYAGGRIKSGYKQANYNLQATREAIRQSMQGRSHVKKSFYGYLLAANSSMSRRRQWTCPRSI